MNDTGITCLLNCTKKTITLMAYNTASLKLYHDLKIYRQNPFTSRIWFTGASLVSGWAPWIGELSILLSKQYIKLYFTCARIQLPHPRLHDLHVKSLSGNG